jgi:hypothetical protein
MEELLINLLLPVWQVPGTTLFLLPTLSADFGRNCTSEGPSTKPSGFYFGCHQVVIHQAGDLIIMVKGSYEYNSMQRFNICNLHRIKSLT